jgi:AraC-like DNA-binding protein
MSVRTYLPCDALKPYVKIFCVEEKENEKVYHVLPDTGLVIGFQYKGNLRHLHNGNEIPLSASGISGLADHYKVFKSSGDIGTLLVFFREAGASAFFSSPLHELFRESVSLDNFMLRSELLLLEEQLAEAKTDDARVRLVEKFLILRMSHAQPDKLVFNALALIHQSGGNIRIRDLAGQLHTSQSPLEKRFRAVIGASPKKFASIVRFKNALRSYRPTESLTGLSYEAGFYDQAHFIREFKTFTGDTPESFFSSHE